MHTRGLFIDVCAWYWFKDCSVTKAMLEKKFLLKTYLTELYDSEIIKFDGDNVVIEFLNEQYDMLSEKRKARQDAGRRGGKQKSSNAKAKLKQKPSYKDNNKDKYKDKDNSKKCLMKNSNVTIQNIKDAFDKTTDLTKADARHYFNAALDWSDSGSNMRTDWVATVRGFARRDLGDGKLKFSNSAQNTVTRQTTEYIAPPLPQGSPMPDSLKKHISKIGKE